MLGVYKSIGSFTAPGHVPRTSGRKAQPIFPPEQKRRRWKILDETNIKYRFVNIDFNIMLKKPQAQQQIASMN